MNKFLIVSFAIVACALAAPQHQEAEPVHILKQEQDITPEGYNFDFETSDGTSRQESGQLKHIDEQHQAIEIHGQYRYTAPDGLVYTVTYTADEHGFQPQEHVEHPGQQ